jgi:hypothetical protein
VTTAALAPWWGVPLLAGCFTVLGVLISQAASFIVEKRRGDREDARRWDKELRESYSNFSRAAEDVSDALHVDGTTLPDLKPLMDRMSELQLIAPPEVVQAAFDATKAAMLAVLPDRDEDARARARTDYSKYREHFVNVARGTLGMQPLHLSGEMTKFS